MAVDREVIEQQLDIIVPDALATFGKREIVPGWRALSMFGFKTKQVGMARIQYLEGEPLERLLSLADEWPDAFDAASYLAAQAIAAGIALPIPLREFAWQALMNERKRPKKQGRRLSDGKVLALWKIRLVYLLHHSAEIPIARNRQNSGDGQLNACDAVAAAFCRAGKHTTFQQVASLIYDAAYAELREVARVFGWPEVPPSKPN